MQTILFICIVYILLYRYMDTYHFCSNFIFIQDVRHIYYTSHLPISATYSPLVILLILYNCTCCVCILRFSFFIITWAQVLNFFCVKLDVRRKCVSFIFLLLISNLSREAIIRGKWNGNKNSSTILQKIRIFFLNWNWKQCCEIAKTSYMY